MSLQLKILFVTTGLTKTMRFVQTMSVSETLKEIKDKTGEGGRDHGLMRPADPESGRNARWLKPDRTLQFYDIKAGETLELRKKHRALKIKLMDDTIKTVLIDDSLPVSELVEMIGIRMGLRNPEEFSLAYEEQDEDSMSAVTSSGKKGKKKGKKGAAAQGPARKKDGTPNWLNPAQCLVEQGVPEEAILSLKKKFFVDDANVDMADPIQLHLVYVQSHEGVVSGRHPTTKEEAVQFAALQCQIVYGNFSPDKHTKLFMKASNRMDEVLPKQYRKLKNIYTDLVREWQGLSNMSDTNAKYRYVQLCRSLKTYGITYYSCRWKAKGKKKLEPILLGITRDSVLCVDPESQHVKEEHPLTHLKRWAAGPSSFTLDFGDYRDEYMALQTNEGEAMSQLLAGYIDILLKRRHDGGVVIEDDEGEVAEEEHVAAVHGQAMASTTTTTYDGSGGQGGQTSVLSDGGQIAGLSPGIAGMLGNIANLSDADGAILDMLNDLMSPLPIGKHGAMSPEQLRSLLAKYNNKLAETAGELIREAATGQATREDLDKHSQPLAINLAHLIGAARQAAAAAGGDVSLLDGAKAVSDALRKLMVAAGEMADNPNALSRAHLFEAASLLQATSAALNATACGNMADDPSKNLLLESARAVAAATRDLLNTSNASVANADEGTRNIQKAGAAKVEVSNSKVEGTAHCVAPVIADAQCQKYMVSAAQALTEACGHLISSTQYGVKDAKYRNDLAKVSKDVSDAIAQLVSATQCVGTRKQANLEKMFDAALEIQDAVAQLMSSEGNADQIVAASRAVSTSSASLISAAKAVAKDSDPVEKDRLLEGVTAVANATREMLQSVAPSAQDPANADKHRALREAAARVAEATRNMLGDTTTKAAALNGLRSASKAAAAATSSLVAHSKGVYGDLDTEGQSNVGAAVPVAAKAVRELVESIKNSWLNPVDERSNKKLIESAMAVAKPSAGLVATARAVVPKVKDMQQKKNLNQAAANVSDALRKLMEAIKAVKEADGHMEVDQALEDFAAYQADLEHALISAQDGSFEPIAGQTREGAMSALKIACEQLKEATNQLTDAAKVSPQAMGPPAKATTSALGQVFGASKAVASTTDSKRVQTKILSAAAEVAAAVQKLINAGRAVSNNPSDNDLNSVMNVAFAESDNAIDQLLLAATNAGAGSEECDTAGEQIMQHALELLNGIGSSNADMQELAEELAACCKALESAVTQVADNARNHPKDLGASASLTASTIPPVLKTTNNAAGKAPDQTTSANILAAGKQLAEDTTAVLSVAKAVTASPGDATKDQELSNSVKAVKTDIESLLKAVDAGVPGKKDMMDAQEVITSAIGRMLKPGLETDNPQVHLREISDAARKLVDSIGRIVASARNFPEKLGPYSKEAADSVSDIVDASKDAASADPPAVILLSTYKIETDTAAVISDTQDTAAVVEGAKELTRDATGMVSNVKKAAQKEKDANARRQLITAAEQAVNTTKEIAATAKLVSRKQPGAEQKLQAVVKSLEPAIKAVLAYKKTNGEMDFRPLLEAARSVALETNKMIDILKVVSGRPKDAAAQTKLSLTSKSTIDAIKQLIQAVENLTYGDKECKEAIDTIQRAIGDLDAAAINATVGLLDVDTRGMTNQQCKEQLIALSRDLANVTGQLVTAAKSKPEDLGGAAIATTIVVPKIVDSAKCLAATTTDSDTQQNQLNLAKNMIDAMLHLVRAAKDTSGNPHDAAVLANLAETARTISNAITELVSSLKGGVMGLRACDEAMAAIDAAISELGRGARSNKSYAQASDELNNQARGIVASISTLCNTAKNDPESIGDSTKALSAVVPQLIAAINTTSNATNEEEVKARLLATGKGVVLASRNAVSAAKNVAADPKNENAIQSMSEAQRNVTQAIADLLNAVKAGATLERDAELALSKIQGTIADLDAASLFAAATAGQLDVPLARGETLDSCQQKLSAAAKKLSAAAQLVQKHSGSAGSKGQEELGNSFKQFASEMESVGKASKEVASLMSDLISQQDVLTASKAAAIASQSLVLSSKEAMTQGDAATQKKLADSSKACLNAIQELVQVSENASAAVVKGIRELEKAISAIQQQQQQYEKESWPGQRGAAPEDILNSAKVLASASGNIVSTCTSDNEGLVSAAKSSGEGMCSLIAACRGASKLTQDSSVLSDLDRALQSCAENTLALLEAAKTAKDTAESQKHISSLSEKVADKIMEIVGAARRLPGGEKLRGLWEDEGEDLEALCERELQKAARMIEEAAKRLLEARPKKVKTDTLDEQDINAAILEAAKAITDATAALVRAATSAQAERIRKRRDPKTKHFYRKDPAWANGLISAAQEVGGTTQDLVSSANGFVKKEEGKDEDILIAAAKQVAASTARLMAASRAKSDPFSDSHKNLAAASKAVAAATQMLVDAAKKAGISLNEPSMITTAGDFDDMNQVAERMKRLKAQQKMIKLEKELQQARELYTNLNKAGYQGKNK